MLSVSARTVSLRAQPLSGSRFPRPPSTGGGLRPCGSATLGSWPWSARSPWGSTPSPASPTGACAPRSPDCSAPPTPPTRWATTSPGSASTGSSSVCPAATTYLLTEDGQRVAMFYSKVHDRLLRPLIAANRPPAPVELRDALHTVDRHVRHYIRGARLGNVA